MKRLFILMLLLFVPVVHAEVTLFTNQTEYIFPFGEEALITIQTNNTGSEESGLLTYTVGQRVQQGGLNYQNTEQQTQSLAVAPGEEALAFSLGSANTPAVVTLDLSFAYAGGTATLETITVRFVQNPQEQNQQQSQQQNQAEQNQEEQGEEEQEDYEPQTDVDQTQEKIQQNNQDSSALQQQLRRDRQRQQQQDQALQEQINQALQEQDQQLREEGYESTNEQVKSETGEFNKQYQKPNGEQANLTGTLQNQSVNKLTETRNSLPEELRQQIKKHPEFQEFHNQLTQDGLTETSVQLETRANQTEVEFTYQQGNETAHITVLIEDETITEVTSDWKKRSALPWIIVVILLMALIYYVYTKGRTQSEQQALKTKPFNYKLAAKKLLHKAEEAFEKKQYKDAYGKAAQAVRLYLSYTHGLKKELTNDAVIKHLRNTQTPYKQIKTCLDLSSLVQFAKYKPNKADFDKLMYTARIVCGTKKQ